MLKFILLAVIFYLLLSLSLQILIRKKKNRAVGGVGAGVENAPQIPAETLVACVRCGVFFQPSRGFEVAGECYCSRKCLP